MKLRKSLCFHWNLFHKNVIIRSYDCVAVPAVFSPAGKLVHMAEDILSSVS